MRTAAIEDGMTMNVGVMDTCSEPIDPSSSLVQAEMARLGELSPQERGVEYHDVGRACLELCGAENVVYLDPEAARKKCFEARVTRAALVSYGVYVEGDVYITDPDELSSFPDLLVEVSD